MLTSGTADVASRNMFDRRTKRNNNHKEFELCEGMISLHSFHVQEAAQITSWWLNMFKSHLLL